MTCFRVGASARTTATPPSRSEVAGEALEFISSNAVVWRAALEMTGSRSNAGAQAVGGPAGSGGFVLPLTTTRSRGQRSRIGYCSQARWSEFLRDVWHIHCSGVSRQPTRLAWGEVSDLDQPADGVGEGVPKWAGLERELAPRLGVVASGGAVHDPDPLGVPRQPRPDPALDDVGRAAEPGQEPRREGREADATTGEVGERADEVGHRE